MPMAHAQRMGYGLDLSGGFGPDPFFTSGLCVSALLRVPGHNRGLLVIAGAEGGRKAFRGLFHADRVLFAWRAGLGYQWAVGDARTVLIAGPYLAYASHHHLDRSDPSAEQRWTRPYMQAGLHLCWTRLLDREGRYGLDLRLMPAVMGLVGDGERLREDVPPPMRWVLPVQLGMSKAVGGSATKAPEQPMW